MKQSINVTDVCGSQSAVTAGDGVGLGVDEVRKAKIQNRPKMRGVQSSCTLWGLAALSGTWSTWNALRPFSALGSCP